MFVKGKKTLQIIESLVIY